MKMVKFTRPMAPHVAGETRVVPDDVADRLVKEDAATVEPSVFDQSRGPELKKAKRYETRSKGGLI